MRKEIYKHEQNILCHRTRVHLPYLPKKQVSNLSELASPVLPGKANIGHKCHHLEVCVLVDYRGSQDE